MSISRTKSPDPAKIISPQSLCPHFKTMLSAYTFAIICRKNVQSTSLWTFSSAYYIHKMSHGGDGIALLGRERAHKRARGDKKDVFKLAVKHFRDYCGAQNRRRAAAARAARVDVLNASVKNHQSAVVMSALYFEPLLREQVIKTS